MTDPAEADREREGNLAGSALMHIEDAYLVAEPNFDDAEYTLEEWHALASFADRLSAAARAFKKHCHNQIAQGLGIGSKAGVRFGDHFIREGQGGTWKVKNPEGLREFIADVDGWDMVNLSAPGAVTYTRLKEFLIAAKWSAETIDTFMEREPDGSLITVTPIDKAPKFAAKLSHGERYIPKPKKPAKPRLEAGE